MGKTIDTFKSSLISGLVGKRRERDKKAEDDSYVVWTSEKVNEARDIINKGGIHDLGSPYKDNIIGIKKAGLVFEWSSYEFNEFKRCSKDIKYFAETYCQIKNDGVYGPFLLREYQSDLMDLLQKSQRTVIMASRQTGKTITTAITLLHYMIFNKDQKALLLANKKDTVVEVIDKIKEIYERLPFWLQPGVDVYNQKTVSFDNGCTMVGLATSKNMGIGFTADFVFIDEAAHIEPNLIEKIWSSIMPTLDANTKSKMVVSSTPLGKNFFWKIWKGATSGASGFDHFKALWNQVEGRDEAWKEKKIYELGNGNYEEGLDIFTREYDCLFVTDSTMLIDVETIDKLYETKQNFKFTEIPELEDTGLDYSGLIWNPEFIETIKGKSEEKPIEDVYVVISLDLGKGLSGDYTVASIFEIGRMDKNLIEQEINPKNEYQFLTYTQIGMFRSNKTDASHVAQIVMELVKMFDNDKALINFEANRLGEYFYKCLEDDEDFYDDLVIHTRHSKLSYKLSPGVLITTGNKVEYCKDMKKKLMTGKMVVTEPDTIEELASFGANRKKTGYEAQIGNDDIVMSMVCMSALEHSFTFQEFASDIIDGYGKEWIDMIFKKIGTNIEIDNKIESTSHLSF